MINDSVNTLLIYVFSGILFFIIVSIFLLLYKNRGEKKIVVNDKSTGKDRGGMNYWDHTKSGIKWALITAFIIFPLVWFMGVKLILPPTYRSIKETILSLSDLSIPAVFEWKLNHTQLGNKRDGAFKAEIKRDNESDFSFVFYYDYGGKRREAYFIGKKNRMTKRIEGFWSQDCPEDGGKWYLEPDQYSFSTKAPDSWKGGHYCQKNGAGYVAFTLRKL